MVRTHCVELPQSSVAVQVRTTVYSCGQVPGVVASLNVMDTLASHASVAVATPKLGVAGHSTEAVGFGHVMTGAVLSVTEIVRAHCVELPQSSVAVQVRTTVYSCGQVPGVVASLNVMDTDASHASVAVAAPKLGVAGHSIEAVGFGHVIDGAVLSVTEMERAQVAVFPQSSVAVHVRVTVYSCGQVPGVVTLLNVMDTDKSQLSVADAAPKVGVAGHSIGETTAGQVMTGGVSSSTVMPCWQLAELPQSSVTVCVRITIIMQLPINDGVLQV